MPTIRQLEYLVAVVDFGTFTEAAQRSHVTQPGLSHQIKALEADLGGAVLERLTGGVRLTTLGRAVLPHARAVLADVHRLADTASVVVGLSGGTLELSTVTSLSLGVLPDLAKRWRQAHPQVSLRLREYRTMDALLDDLSAGVGDVAIAPTPKGWSGQCTPIGDEELVVVVATEHPLADTQAVRFADLREQPWVRFSDDHGLSTVLDHLAQQAGFEPIEAMRTEQTAAGPLYAAAGIGACLMPSNAISRSAQVHRLHLDPPVLRQVSAFGRTSSDPMTQAFVTLAVRHTRLRE